MKRSAVAVGLLVAGLAWPAAAQVSGNVVKIGVLNDQSGVYADFGGKVLDAPIEIVSADHQNKPDIGSNIARQWFDVDGVDMIS